MVPYFSVTMKWGIKKPDSYSECVEIHTKTTSSQSYPSTNNSESCPHKANSVRVTPVQA